MWVEVPGGAGQSHLSLLVFSRLCEVCEAIGLSFFNSPFQAGIVFFCQLLEQYLEGSPGFYLCFHCGSVM